MKKFKKVLLGALSVLTFGLFAATTTNVLAAGEPEEFSAQNLTAGSTINSGTKFYDGTLFDLTMSGTGAYVTTIGGCEYDNSVKSSTNVNYTATANDSSGKTYTQAVLPSSTTGNNKVIQITTGNSAINAKVYYTMSDSNFVFTTDKNGNTVAEGYAKSGNIIIAGSESSTTGNKARNVAYVENATIPASTTVSIYSSSNRVVLFGVVAEEATVTSYDVTFMDGSNELEVDTVVSGSTINYTPVKYGYDFEGWYTDASIESQYKINTSTYTVTGDVTLYANWTAWTNTGITEYTLTNSAISKISTGIDGNLSADLALTPSIYTAMTGVGMTTTNVTLPGASSATQAPCFNTNGAVTTSGYGLKFTAPSNGVFTTWIGSGGGSSRDIKFTSDGSTSILPTTGNANDLKIRYSNTGAEDPYDGLDVVGYEPREISFAVEAGTTYYLGGTNGVRIYYISFTPNAEIALGTSTGVSTVTNGNNAVRCYAAINLNTTETIKNISVKAIGFDGEDNQLKTATAEGLTFYDTLNIDGCDDTNTLYTYYSVYGLTSTYNGYKIKFEFTVTLSDDSKYTESLTYTVEF